MTPQAPAAVFSRGGGFPIFRRNTVETVEIHGKSAIMETVAF